MENTRVLNFFSLVAIGLGSSLGIGVYVVVGDVVKNVPGISFEISILLTCFTALLAGLIFTEFAVWFLRANTSYTFFYACGNENVAFILGWILILKHVAGTACVIKGVILFIDAILEKKISNFLEETVPLNTAYISSSFDFVSVVVVIIITLLLACGIKDNLILKSIFTLANVLLLVSIIVAGSFKVNLENWYVEESINGELVRNNKPCDFVLVLKQAATLFVGFIGFDTIGLTAEVKKRHKIIPAAVFLTIFLSLLAFFGVGNILLLINPYYKIVSYASLPFAFEQVGWVVAKWVIVAGVCFGFQTSLFGIFYPLPAVITSLASDGILFNCLGKINDKTNTPVIATGISGLLVAVAAGFLTFIQLISLTVISTLFLFNMLAISIILLRYTPNSVEEEPTATSTNSLYPFMTTESPLNQTVSLSNILKNLFNFKQKVTTNITPIIAIWNLLLYGISSIALSILLIYYFDNIKSLEIDYVVPSSVCLALLFFTLISLISQPKSSTPLFFKVPFTPLVPCLSILMNILFSVSFGAISWIFFGIWLGIGIIPYWICYFLRCRRSLVNENSIYDINKMNALKLNEAVWKIISERPSFYEGKVNPAFNEESDEKSEIRNINEKRKCNHEKIELNKASILQTAEIVPEEKIEPLVMDGESKFLNEDDRVEWQCVAEIHNSEEFPQENVVLEIVDTSYNFLSEALTNDGDSSSQVSTETLRKLESSEAKEFPEGKSLPTEKFKTSPKIQDGVKVKRNYEQNKKSSSTSHIRKKNFVPVVDEKSQTMRPTPMLSRKLLEEIQDTVRLKKERMKALNDDSFVPFKPQTLDTNSEEKDSKSPNKEVVETQEKPDVVKEEKKINFFTDTMSDKTKAINPETPKHLEDSSDEDSVSKEHSKVKEFKEKLNQLLKSQIDINSSYGRKFLNAKLIHEKNSEVASETHNSDDEFYKTVKTLNKVQIKDKLELLLTKGPPKRPSLRDSFNIKVNKNDEDKDLEKKDVELNSQKITT